MRTSILPLALGLGLLSPIARAQHPAHTSGGQAAAQHAMQQQLRQQQQMVQQQQRLVQQQQRAAQQQQRVMVQQQQRAAQQQQRVMQQQHRAAQQAQAKAAQAQAGSPKPGTAAAKKGAATHHLKGTHVVLRPHRLFLWPLPSSPAARHLQRLKTELDGIAARPSPTAAQRSGLRLALSGVVEGAPRPQSAHVRQLADHLTTALAGRGGSVDTRQLALQLRGMMNSPRLSAPELDQALVDSQGVLLGGGVAPTHVGVISDDLRLLSAGAQGLAP